MNDMPISARQSMLLRHTFSNAGAGVFDGPLRTEVKPISIRDARSTSQKITGWALTGTPADRASKEKTINSSPADCLWPPRYRGSPIKDVNVEAPPIPARNHRCDCMDIAGRKNLQSSDGPANHYAVPIMHSVTRQDKPNTRPSPRGYRYGSGSEKAAGLSLSALTINDISWPVGRAQSLQYGLPQSSSFAPLSSTRKSHSGLADTKALLRKLRCETSPVAGDVHFRIQHGTTPRFPITPVRQEPASDCSLSQQRLRTRKSCLKKETDSAQAQVRHRRTRHVRFAFPDARPYRARVVYQFDGGAGESFV